MMKNPDADVQDENTKLQYYNNKYRPEFKFKKGRKENELKSDVI